MFITIILPDGSEKQVEKGATLLDVAKSIGDGLKRSALLGKINGEFADLTDEVEDGDKVEIITNRSPEALPVMRHSVAHILAEAVQILWPGTQIGFGPQTDDGFFYDFALPEQISVNDFQKIEQKMCEIIKKDDPFVKKVVSRDEAKEIFKDQRLKLEHIDDFDDDVKITIRQHGEFVDLCGGPHVASAGMIDPKAIKLTKIAGAYWKGDSNREMLTRIYGTAFFKKKELDDYMQMLDEAKKRDHRKLGRDLGIFTQDDLAGAGLPLYLPKGARVIRIMQEWLRRDLYDRGYEEVITPHVYNADVWKTSGHYGFYKENMYFFNINEGSEESPNLVEYAVKPMNCPGHVMLYRANLHSYRDLPLRYFEFGTVYRHEMSGVVHGLLRARGFTQDDAHVFCTRDQVVDEVVAILDLVDHIMTTFGFEYEAEISTRPDKSIGTDDMWEHATNALKQACSKHNLSYEINEGDGAFYGPKIDIKVKDALCRTWQCSTVQVDFNMPERFNLTYRAADNSEQRPWMLHRAIFGSIERFLGILIEHYAGAFPLWLSPVQVAIIPITDRQRSFARDFGDKLKSVGGRVEYFEDNEPMKVKIAKAQSEKIPYMVVIGDKEMQENKISVRDRFEGDKGEWEPQKLVDIIANSQL